VVPTLIVSVDRTEALRREARVNTPPVVVSYAIGQAVIPAGAMIDAAGLEAIEKFGLRHGAATRPAIVATAIGAALAGAAMGAYVFVVRPLALRGARRLFLFMLLLVTPTAIAKFALTLTVPDVDRLFLAQALP